MRFALLGLLAAALIAQSAEAQKKHIEADPDAAMIANVEKVIAYYVKAKLPDCIKVYDEELQRRFAGCLTPLKSTGTFTVLTKFTVSAYECKSQFVLTKIRIGRAIKPILDPDCRHAFAGMDKETIRNILRDALAEALQVLVLWTEKNPPNAKQPSTQSPAPSRALFF